MLVKFGRVTPGPPERARVDAGPNESQVVLPGESHNDPTRRKDSLVVAIETQAQWRARYGLSRVVTPGLYPTYLSTVCLRI
jgi:hypothetical protein